MSSDIKALEFEKPIVELEEKIKGLKALGSSESIDFAQEIDVLTVKCEELKKNIYGSLTPWQRVQLARHPNRLYSLDYIRAVFHDFTELHGDRCFADDQAIVGGMAYLDEVPVIVFGHQKGRTVHESMNRNFGMPHPEGYRKALRLMRLAERFGKPVICFIDTPGAYPGIGAEERGQATAIAENLREMSDLKVPIICVIIGEGGSGGALAIGVGNTVIMLENSWYSVISPEGCAAILFRDSGKAAQAAQTLKLTSFDLKEFGIIDEIIPEPLGGVHRAPEQVFKVLKSKLLMYCNQLLKLSPDELIASRKKKYRMMGAISEEKKADRQTTRKKKK
ncbi:MAG: acetyl-CoA carboxylase carboxyltransferase subunit alpha [Elusimicrobia bacterium]|nr:acetyl-CoA carboxylase carboxyltransferase subunit alpha [Elusimicrobiota bacterium]MBD3411826.1 acetyl-CoA carboxylase carboxyltransferase subunit alpha [Elusimicrobiota bacterium]